MKEGYESFKKGGVLEFKNLGGGDYEAVVDAFSSTNLVRLHVEGNEMSDCSCDCAFLRRGSICPHIVATLFYLQKDLFDDDEGIMPKKPAKPKRPSPAKQFRDLLKTISHEELKKFMQEVSYSYPNIRDSFISRYAHHLYPEYKETYTERVQALIKKYANPYGFVDYVESSPLSRSIRDLIGESSVSFERGNIQKGIYILEAIVEEMTKTLRHADDGKERMSESISLAFEQLSIFANSNLKEPVHKELFEWLLKLFDEGTLKHRMWHYDVIVIATDMIKNDAEKERVRASLNKIKPKGEQWDWNYQQIQNLTARLIKKTEGPEAAARYIENHASNPEFRNLLIKEAVDREDYAKAEQLAIDGIREDERRLPELVVFWRHYLLEIYQLSKNTEQIIQVARQLLIHSDIFFFPREIQSLRSGKKISYTEQTYYQLLKSHVPREQWPEFLERLVEDLSKQDWGKDFDRTTQIYIWEQQWDKLFMLLQKNPNFFQIKSKIPYLKDKYAPKLALLCKDLALKYIANNKGRESNHFTCEHLQLIDQLGERAMAMDLIKELKATYRTRKSLVKMLEQLEESLISSQPDCKN